MKRKNIRFLIVDDDPDLCELIQEELIDEGFETITASSGNEAIKILMDTKVDIILSDIKMPNGTGVDLAKNVHANNEYHPILILMTGFSDISELELKEIGVTKLYNKPIEISYLIDDILSMLEAA